MRESNLRYISSNVVFNPKNARVLSITELYDDPVEILTDEINDSLDVLEVSSITERKDVFRYVEEVFEQGLGNVSGGEVLSYVDDFLVNLDFVTMISNYLNLDN